MKTAFQTIAELRNQDEPLQEQIFDHIKQRVITCDLYPGTDITESSLAAEYAVTKAPIRSALARRREAGWLRTSPRRGHMVAPLTLEDINEIFDARELIEPETARLAAGKMSKACLESLNEPCRGDYDLNDVEGKRTFLFANANFHVGIAQACGNGRLAAMLQQLHEESLRILYLSISAANRSRSWRTGHDSMIDMLISGDATGAAEETLEGIRRSRQSVLESIYAKDIALPS
jgi:GntR family transcriptional regulator, rspAB operon transcriptional repressor